MKKSDSKEIKSEQNNPLWKVILTDIAGVGCLILVPFLGPLPGPGGIPLLITGFGLLAVNHAWARTALKYVRKHSDSVQDVIFPNNPKFEWAWDIASIAMFAIGLYGSLKFDENFWLKILSIGLMAGSTTVFMLNRQRVQWIEKRFFGKK